MRVFGGDMGQDRSSSLAATNRFRGSIDKSDEDTGRFGDNEAVSDMSALIQVGVK